MTESFGAQLRQQRERQQIPLASIADQTKIGIWLLEGLERDDVSHWPAGIFRRSFIRAYAQIIGLEPDAVVREFLELHPDPVEVMAAAPPAGEGETAGRRPPIRLRYLLASAIDSLGRFRHPAVQKPEPAREPVPASSLTPAGKPASMVKAMSKWEPDLSAVAHICTDLGRVLETREVEELLEGATRILDAAGLVVWVWDSHAAALKPALARGYSDEVLAKLPRVRRDADNATAASFRSAETRIVKGSDLVNGAVVVPLMTATGCGGVLAVELRHGGEQKESVRAMMTILAAQLAGFIGAAPLAEAVNA